MLMMELKREMVYLMEKAMWRFCAVALLFREPGYAPNKR